MPPSVGVAAFVFGMVLILAALVGKDLEIAAIKQPVHLDIIDKWYTQAAGTGYASPGSIDPQKIQNALVQAHNDFCGNPCHHRLWVPAFAGMTVAALVCFRMLRVRWMDEQRMVTVVPGQEG
jgi:hypothetical protein